MENALNVMEAEQTQDRVKLCVQHAGVLVKWLLIKALLASEEHAQHAVERA